MATGQTLLDLMNLLNQELQTASGGADVTRALIALNAAQDRFEAVAATYPNIFGSQTGTVTTSANTESTAFPTGVVRLDRLQYIDPTTNRPSWDLVKISKVGGHAWSWYWPVNLTSSSTPGLPRAYYTNGLNIYWDPLPSGTSTVRWYGFQTAADITTGGTFTYPDLTMMPIAGLAVRLMKLGVDDPVGDIMATGDEAFAGAIKAMGYFNRDGSNVLQYRYRHDA